jgi:hypothetical protein
MRLQEGQAMARTIEPTDDTVRELSQDEGRELFDYQARKLLGISGEEFLRRWDAGEYCGLADDMDHPEIMHLAMLRSFGR